MALVYKTLNSERRTVQMRVFLHMAMLGIGVLLPVLTRLAGRHVRCARWCLVLVTSVPGKRTFLSARMLFRCSTTRTKFR